MFGTLFYCKMIFPKKFPKSFSCRFRKKAVPSQQNLNFTIMKAKFFIFALVAAICCACESNGIGDASLIEGGWDLRNIDYDKTVYADYNGNTHLKDSAYTRVFEDKERVWLFYQGSISDWQYFEQDGKGYWTGYACDCWRKYRTEGEGTNLTIVETGGSIIPGNEELLTCVIYKVEKLTNKTMVLSCTDRMYVSDLQSAVDVHVVYTFRRENTLLDYLRNCWP